MSHGRKPLSPVQIQYLRISPKAGWSELSKKQLCQAIRQQKNKQIEGNTSATNSFNKIPKLTYGDFEKTISNFGVLINKNFGNETSVHRSQKFGHIAKIMDHMMMQERDKPIYSEKKNAILKKIKDRSDNRTTISAVCDYENEKLHVTLKSFTIESEKSNEGGLPIPYLRFLIHHVNSGRLVKIIESSIRSEGNQVVVEFDKIENRASHFANNQSKYQNMDYYFERMGQILTVNLPYVEFHHVESNYSQRVQLLNKEIIEIVETGFENVAKIVSKYLDAKALKQAIEQKKQEQLRLKEEAEKEIHRRLSLKKEYDQHKKQQYGQQQPESQHHEKWQYETHHQEQSKDKHNEQYRKEWDDQEHNKKQEKTKQHKNHYFEKQSPNESSGNEQQLEDEERE